MKVLVTGSAGHLGEGLVRRLRADGVHDVVSLDLLPSPFTTHVASITDREAVRAALRGIDAVLHAATLHKPHVATHSRQAFVDVNVTGTLTLLEEAVRGGASRFVFTSTTSTFGHALRPPEGEPVCDSAPLDPSGALPDRRREGPWPDQRASLRRDPVAPAVWITEDVVPIPKNVYGATKTAAEDLCQLVHQDQGLPCLVLRTSRFFPEDDDRPQVAAEYDDTNLKLNELLYRRVDLEDAVEAHLLALERAPALGFGRYIISATTPFTRDDLVELGRDAPTVLGRACPEYAAEYERRGWKMLPRLDRVYVNARARADLGWAPRHDFPSALADLAAGRELGSALAREVGAKGYHRKA